MHMKQLLWLLVGLVIGLAGLGFYTKAEIARTIINAPYHAHADFAVLLDGKRFDFAKHEYMSNEPCLVGSIFPTADAHGGEGDLSDKVHMHNMNGNVVHVHHQGITWADFFKSIKMELTSSSFTDEKGKKAEASDTKEFRFMKNGKDVKDLFSLAIQDQDRVLVSYGDKSRSKESTLVEYAQITNDACLYSHSCLERGPAPIEQCGKENTSWLLGILGLE